MSRTLVLVLLIAAIPAVRGEDKKPPLAAWAKKSQARTAYGMYFGKTKAGWVVEETKLGERDGKPVYLSSSETFTSTAFDGQKSTKTEKTLTVYSLEGDGAILYAETKSNEDGKGMSRVMTRTGDKLEIATTQGKRVTKRTIDLPKDTLAEQRALESWLTAADRKDGDTFVRHSTDWEKTDVNGKLKHTFKGRKDTTVAGVEVKLADVVVEIEGGRMATKMLPDAKMLEATLGGIMTIKMEKEEDAKKLDGKPVDLLGVSGILVDKNLGLPQNVDTLVLDVTGVDDFTVPASHRQISEKVTGGVRLTVKRDFRVEKAAPLADDARKENLAATPRIQCDQEAIAGQAKKIVGDEADALKKATLLKAWVYKTLRKSYKDNADTSLEVLDNKAGDCTEHTLLFTALARAAGVPAREVGGLAYIPGRKPMFGWHAWAEVHDGHQWVSVDPTWNQVYVDGTHVKMSEGHGDLAWANVAGKMKMSVVSFEKKGRK